ncbi:MAG: lysoplasmalogenase [Clostridia bacterium]|nr:lysoplasmalogenase [Clostridia bacterium]
MKKLFTVLNILMVEAIVILVMLYSEFGGVELKAATSSMFVILSGINLVYACLNKTDNLKYYIFMVAAFVIAMAGDVVLYFDFMVGAIIFAIGHIFYFVAYSIRTKIKLTDFIYSAAVFVPSALLILLEKSFDFGGALMQVICLVYALIISLMLGKAIANTTREFSMSNIIILIGSALFFLSDLMLLLCYFGNGGMLADIICLATYFPGQGLLAYSLFHIENEKESEKKQIE